MTDLSLGGRALRFVAIGASSGGPAAMLELLRAMGPGPPVGVVVVQHITDGFESDFAEWLASELGLDVRVARDGEDLKRGQVRVAPPDVHLTLDPGGRVRIDVGASPVKGHRPAVDLLFRSLLDHEPEDIAAVLLSGMGDDGADGMAELKRSDVLTIVQDEESSAIFGMPKAAIERNGAALTLPPREIGRVLARAAGRRDV